MDKICYILAGPNGAGKTTFADEFLPVEANCINFINADLIAGGISPYKPEKSALEAGRIMLKMISDYVEKGESFAFETTLSGKSYEKKIIDWKSKGYQIIIYYFKLSSVELSKQRVKIRFANGGHNIPEKDIQRRFNRSWNNFNRIYKPLADSWTIIDTSGSMPEISEESE